MRFAALNTGNDFHLLDHIAPLSWLLDMPLFVTEEKNFDLAKRYYPFVQTHYMPDLEQNLLFFAEHFDALFECKYWDPNLKKTFLHLFHKNMLLVHAAHGQSDKGYAHPLLRHYEKQDAALIYGELLKIMLEETKTSCNTIFTGNYRLLFYLHHQEFYDSVVEKEIFSSIPKHKKILFYAPTWKDSDSATTFFTSTKELLKRVPENWHILFKAHPLLEQRNPADFYRLEALIQKHPNATLLLEIPLIYPLLKKADRFLGDYSSVGYDFLYFKKPMFFLLHESLPKGRLHECGTILSSLEPLFHESPKDATENQKKLYHFAFGQTQEKNILQEHIKKQLSSGKQDNHVNKDEKLHIQKIE